MNYPNNLKKNKNGFINYGNRGMLLENILNNTNQHYLENDIAIIYKKPTPIGINKVGYENNRKIIKSAYFSSPSTLDYNGIYKSKYIEFDAKESSNKTSFPLSNIHEHQTIHIKKIIKHGGICFLIIKMNDIIYLLDGKDYIDFLNNNSRKSIPINYLNNFAFKIPIKLNQTINYLEVIENIYFKENSNEEKND